MGARASNLSMIFRASGVKRLKGSTLAPKGYVPICVGVNNETKRFMVHTTSFRDAEFTELLCRSADEYGFCNQGVLRIPYDAKDFEEQMIKRARRKILRVRPT